MKALITFGSLILTAFEPAAVCALIKASTSGGKLLTMSKKSANIPFDEGV
jgi:hypothetical protein